MMIITLTMNPAVDKTATVKRMKPGTLHRLQTIRMDAGGKGINVSKTIKAIQGTSLCMGFLAGSSGSFIETELTALGISHDFCWVDGMTRTNLKIIDEAMELSEFNEPGPIVSKDDIAALEEKLCTVCGEDTIVVLSGNACQGVAADRYHHFINCIKEKKGKVILDADGDFLLHGIQAKPTVLKPNLAELSNYFGKDEHLAQGELISLTSSLLNEDTRLIVVSLGSKGSIFFYQDRIWKVEAINVNVSSCVGAGDAMVAGIAYALDRHFDIEDLIKLSVACGTGAVTTHGTNPAEQKLIQELMKSVKLIRIK